MPSGVKDIQLLELKDTISQLNKTISTQNELISSLQKMLEERNAKDSEKDLLIANLQSQLAYLKNKVFGSTSEIRHDQLDGQLNLFGTPVGDEKPAEVIEPEVISVKGYTKERKPKATYDDKYNSVRSICKHFFTDIVGLSIKFFCVSLRHMSIGLPDIVLFVGMLLKGIYETALRYGFPYEGPAEQMWILRMMETSLTKGSLWTEKNQGVDAFLYQGLMEEPTKEALSQQIQATAQTFAMDMLVLKFIQGLPLVGVLGGAANPVYYRRVLNYVQLKYQKRYLYQKRREMAP